MNINLEKLRSLLWYSKEAYGRPVVVVAAFGACAALLAMEIAVLWLLYNNTIELQFEKCKQQLDTASTHINRVIAESDRSILGIVSWITSNPAVDPLHSAELVRFAESTVVDKRDAAALGLISMGGQATILDRTFSGRVFDVSARPYMAAVRAAELDSTNFGPMVVNANTGRRTISMFRAAMVGGDRYAIASAFSVEHVEEFLASLLEGPGRFMLLLEGDKQISMVADEVLKRRFGPTAQVDARSDDLILCRKRLDDTAFTVVGGSTLSSVREAWLKQNLPTTVLFGLILVAFFALSIFVAALFGRLWVRDREFRSVLEGANDAIIMLNTNMLMSIRLESCPPFRFEC